MFNKIYLFGRKYWVLILGTIAVILMFIIPDRLNSYSPRYFKTQQKEPEGEKQQSITPEQNTETGKSEPSSIEMQQTDLLKLAEGDILYSKMVTKYRNTYPFLTKIPIDKPEYFIVFDFDTQRFRIRLKMKEQDATKEKIDLITAEAVADIKNVGGNSYGFYVVYME